MTTRIDQVPFPFEITHQLVNRILGQPKMTGDFPLTRSGVLSQSFGNEFQNLSLFFRQRLHNKHLKATKTNIWLFDHIVNQKIAGVVNFLYHESSPPAPPHGQRSEEHASMAAIRHPLVVEA
jgi:hypothetical protein